MDENIYGANPEDSILNQVKEGMTVFDREHTKIGKVKDIRFGDADSAALDQGRGPASVPGKDPSEDAAVFPNFAVGFAGTSTDDTEIDIINKQMQRSGYIRIDSAGIFSNDRYVLPDQIESVHDDEVMLKVMKEELPKAR